MENLDIIVLSLAKDEAHFQMVKKCVESYLQDGDRFIKRIVLVESNKNFDLSVWSSVSNKILAICPEFDFNYNKFLNIALEHCDSEFICISNSDLKVLPNCVGNILKEFEKDSELMSASPVDRTWHQNSYNNFPLDDHIYYGYQTTKYLLGFNIYCRRSVYDVIGKYDERFGFYHQDNDYEVCLKVNKLKHALVTSAHIVHGENKPDTGVSTEETHKKLRESGNTFLSKWRYEPFTKKFLKYVKLAVVTDDQIGVDNDLVKFYNKNDEEVYGQYVFDCNMTLTEDLIKKILYKIDKFNPSKIEIDSNNFVIKKF
jgi:hypothetical protein